MNDNDRRRTPSGLSEPPPSIAESLVALRGALGMANRQASARPVPANVQSAPTRGPCPRVAGNIKPRPPAGSLASSLRTRLAHTATNLEREIPIDNSAPSQKREHGQAPTSRTVPDSRPSAPAKAARVSTAPRVNKQGGEKVTVYTAIGACRGALLGTAGISFVTNLLMLTGPLFMLQIYDRVPTSRSVPTLVALVVLISCSFCVMGVLELIRWRILLRIGLRIDRILSKPGFASIVRVTPSKSGNGQTQPLQDLDHLRNFMSGPGPGAVFDMPWTPIYFTIIFLFHWTLGLVAVIGAVSLLCLSIVNEFASRKPIARACEQFARNLAMAEAGRR